MATMATAQMLLHAGRKLGEDCTLEEAGLVDGAALSVTSRLLGGGGDGGSTGAESRSCYLEMYQSRKPDKVDPAEELLARCTRCRLSNERLAPPCAIDELGSLYNKEAVVHALLHKTLPPALGHITSLKALTPVKLTPMERGSGGAKSLPSSAGAQASARGSADFQCPVTGLEMNGRVAFVAHRPSGVVLSERALRDVPAAAEELLGGRWTAADLIPLHPQGEELERRMEAVAAALAQERARKAAKKAAKAASKGAATGQAAADALTTGGGRSPTEAAAAAAAGPAAAAAAAGGAGKRPLAPGGGVGGGAPAAAAAAAHGGGAAAAKRLKLPAGATPQVYASIFSSNNGGQDKVKETFCCRALSGRGLGMAG